MSRSIDDLTQLAQRKLKELQKRSNYRGHVFVHGGVIVVYPDRVCHLDSFGHCTRVDTPD